MPELASALKRIITLSVMALNGLRFATFLLSAATANGVNEQHSGYSEKTQSCMVYFIFTKSGWTVIGLRESINIFFFLLTQPRCAGPGRGPTMK